MLDLARARVREPVKIPRPSFKRAKITPKCIHDDTWEESTQMLASTLETASWVMVEEDGEWKFM